MPADVNFEKLLEEYNQEYVESEAYSNWMPPEGTYLVLYSKLAKGTAPQEGGKDLVWWRLTGQIIDEGSYKDRTFMIAYLSNKAFGFVKAMTEALSGTPAKNLAEADRILEEETGAVLQVTVETTTSKKHPGRTFKNTVVDKKLETQAAETTSPEA